MQHSNARASRMLLLLLVLLLVSLPSPATAEAKVYETKSGVKLWADPTTPSDRWQYTTSRGRTWELVMSDEFNTPNRSFRPGDDHIWTSLEKPDGVNGALQIYSHNMTSTACDDKDGATTCYMYIKVTDEEQRIRVFNAYSRPPSFTTASFFYRAAMLQSWNKFCFQGGMLEVRAQLPGIVSSSSGNPDLKLGKSTPAIAVKFYPTWPGIWMMGNLGRAIFSASTNRMWPFSYSRCEPDLFEPSNQRISACDSHPGFGLNKNQGRGAPEIDLLEGSGFEISSSIQIAPGMPPNFRIIPPESALDGERMFCIYTHDCKTVGANGVDFPMDAYSNKRGHKSWYQGLRYAANNFCFSNKSHAQSYTSVEASLKLGVSENKCTSETCPASLDINADLGLIDGAGSSHWGINANGSCFPLMNAYQGSYLCDPDNQNPQCPTPRSDSTPPTKVMKSFSYQMDAISANWPVHLAAYLDYLVYQVEWVTGESGYLRWMLNGHVLFEVTADAISNVPQDAANRNLKKLMIEEPMSLIINVALSSSWGSTPPNPGKPCRGDGSNAEDVRICDELPIYLKVDYIRLYQDPSKELEPDNYMHVGCDPKSHPTRAWINAHIDEYQDEMNTVVEVIGKAFCRTDADCTVGDPRIGRLQTGSCVSNRCQCLYPHSWGGPRCTVALADLESSSKLSTRANGPPMVLAIVIAALTWLTTVLSVALQPMSKQLQAVVQSHSKEMEKIRSSTRDSLFDYSILQQSRDQIQVLRASASQYHSNFV